MKFLHFLFFLFLCFPFTRAAQPVVGAERTDLYLPLLEGKRVALLSNHTGLLSDGTHTLDTLLAAGVDVKKLFSPEHGFRGTADAGEKVAGSIDAKSGLPIVSLYDGKNGQRAGLLDDVDVVICDLQDVGLRFYTYYCTMLELMNAAAEAGREFIVFDRPNPNGMYVDGPILDMTLSSGVGRLPIPVVHGLTLGELARMINGEGWLKNGGRVDLQVIPCDNYTHATRYSLPVAPSPNLKTMGAVYLYPSTCLFEGTIMSLGRGTDAPFEMYGHPGYRGSRYSFTPRSLPGAVNPPLLGQRCFGVDLRGKHPAEVVNAGLDLSYVIDAYNHTRSGSRFFTPFFDKLIGNRDIKKLIMEGKSAAEIKKTWQDDVESFKKQRFPYLLYPEK